MAGFGEVMERLVGDPAFRALLASEPDRALAAYELTDDERSLLAGGLEEEAGIGSGPVEGRTSKAGLAGLLALGTDPPASGDPDAPVITGRAYNAEGSPPASGGWVAGVEQPSEAAGSGTGSAIGSWAIEDNEDRS